MPLGGTEFRGLASGRRTDDVWTTEWGQEIRRGAPFCPLIDFFGGRGLDRADRHDRGEVP